MGVYQTKSKRVDAWQWLPDEPLKAGQMLGAMIGHGLDISVGQDKKLAVGTGGGRTLTLLPMSWLVYNDDGFASYSMDKFGQLQEANRPIYLTTAEVAERYRTSAETVRYWRHAGTGPKSIKVGRRVLYEEQDLLAYEAKLRVAS